MKAHALELQPTSVEVESVVGSPLERADSVAVRLSAYLHRVEMRIVDIPHYGILHVELALTLGSVVVAPSRYDLRAILCDLGCANPDASGDYVSLREDAQANVAVDASAGIPARPVRIRVRDNFELVLAFLEVNADAFGEREVSVRRAADPYAVDSNRRLGHHAVELDVRLAARLERLRVLLRKRQRPRIAALALPRKHPAALFLRLVEVGAYGPVMRNAHDRLGRSVLGEVPVSVQVDGPRKCAARRNRRDQHH